MVSNKMIINKIKRFFEAMFSLGISRKNERKILNLSKKLDKIELHLVEQSNTISMLAELIYAVQTDGIITHTQDDSLLMRSGQDKKIYLLNYLPGSDDDDIMN